MADLILRCACGNIADPRDSHVDALRCKSCWARFASPTQGADVRPVASDLQAFADTVRNGIADYIADNMADRKHSLAEIDAYVRAIEINASRLATRDATPTVDARPTLTDEQVENGWRATFSTDNPYCPCNLKSFTKAVRWAERALKSQQDAAIPFRPHHEILDALKTDPKLLADIEKSVAASKESIAQLERERTVTREQLNAPLDATRSGESQRSGDGS